MPNTFTFTTKGTRQAVKMNAFKYQMVASVTSIKMDEDNTYVTLVYNQGVVWRIDPAADTMDFNGAFTGTQQQLFDKLCDFFPLASGSGGGSVAWADITSKPTTVSGFGITDAVSSSGSHADNTIARWDTTGAIIQGGTGAPVYDDTGLFGVATTAPTHSLTLGSTATGIASYNTVDQTTNYERVRQYWSSNTYNITSENGGTGVLRQITLNGNFVVLATSGVNRLVTQAASIGGQVNIPGANSTAGTSSFGITAIQSQSAGIGYSLSVLSTVNQTSTAGYKGIWISPFLQAVGSTGALLIDAGTNTAASGAGTHTSNFSVDNVGVTKIYRDVSNGMTITPSATGSITWDLAGTSPVHTFSQGATFNGSATFAVGFRTNSTQDNSNFAIGSGTGGITSTTSTLLPTAAATVYARRIMRGSVALTPATGTDYSGTIFGGEAVTMFSSGTHNVFAGATFIAPVITTGASTLTDAATIFIKNAPNLGVNKYALEIASGESKLGGAVRFNTTSVSANTTLDDTHYVVRVDATGGARAITLPTASTCTGRVYIIKKSDSSGNAVTFTTLEGAQSLTTQYSLKAIQSNGTAWEIIGN